jgi:hypothetical protein
LARDSCITALPAHWQQQQLMEDFFHTADDWFHNIAITWAIYPVPQLGIGYCPSSNFDGDTLTWSTAVWPSGW